MECCLPLRISQSVEYQLPMPRPPMLRVPTALTSSSLPGLMWGSRFSPGEGRVSVLFWALTCLAASFLSFFVAVMPPGRGVSAGTSAGICVVAGGGAVWSEAAGLFAGLVGDWVDGSCVVGVEGALEGVW